MSVASRAFQAIIFCWKRKKNTVGNRESRKSLTLRCNRLFQLCFWEVNATILGQPSSSLSRWFSADKRSTAPHCHAGRAEKKYNPDSGEALLWYETWHTVSFLFTRWMIYDEQKFSCCQINVTICILYPSNNKNSNNYWWLADFWL